MARWRDIRNLLGDDSKGSGLTVRESGTVVAAGSDWLRIATRRGAVTVRRTDATAYRVGDRVSVLAGQVLGRVRGTPKTYAV